MNADKIRNCLNMEAIKLHIQFILLLQSTNIPVTGKHKNIFHWTLLVQEIQQLHELFDQTSRTEMCIRDRY